MTVEGTIYKITDLEKFMSAYVLNPNKLPESSYQVAKDMRVHVSNLPDTDMPFFPSISRKDSTDSQGRFCINSAGIIPGSECFLSVYKKVDEIILPHLSKPMKIYNVAYRSTKFALEAKSAIKIYIADYKVSNDQGITQSQLNEQISRAKDSLGEVNSLSASINDKKIGIRGSGKGATVTFDIRLMPYTGYKLSRFIKHKMEEFDVNLPGPDFITTLCVREKKIRQKIDESLRLIVESMNEEILDEMIEGISVVLDQPKDMVRAFYNHTVSISFGKLLFPITETRNIGSMVFPTRAIVPEIYVGVPRSIE